MTLRLSFHGGAGTVTGSRHLLDTGRRRVQVDAGLFQGLKSLRELNWREPPYPASSVDHLLLTHAHIDHSGFLPRFVKNGFRGPIHCTAATADLAKILLKDSARIQEQDARYANKKGYSRHRPALPLYTEEDADRALRLLVTHPKGEDVDLGEGVSFRFHEAGHILGSGFLGVSVDRPGGPARFTFSGDVGRYDMPLHLDPDPPPAADFLVVESTYGNRLHDHDPLEVQLVKPLRDCFLRGGVALIPSFAVGRAQQVTLILRELMNDGKLPEVPIHIDSPMAVNATKLYSKYLDEHHLDAELLEDGRSRLFPREVHLHSSVDESKALNGLDGPRVIVSSSGMMTGGRILHHLKRRLPHRENLVLLVGYQAAGTRGRKLLEGHRRLRIHGEDWPVRCEFLSVSGLSAHADRDELLRWVGSAPEPPKAVFVVHGEPESAQALAFRLEQDQGLKTIVPRLDEEHELEPLLA